MAFTDDITTAYSSRGVLVMHLDLTIRQVQRLAARLLEDGSNRFRVQTEQSLIGAGIAVQALTAIRER